MEKIIIGHITLEMLIAFLLGVIGIFLLSAKMASRTELKNGYSITKYLKPTLLNIVYQIIMGFAVLFTLHETAERLVGFSGMGGITGHLTLSVLAGALGGQLFAFIIEKGRKLLNARDEHITHNHGPECNHDS